MTHLIADWDIDAQLLQIAGHEQIKRLPRHTYLRSQVIGRQLAQTSGQLQAVRILPQTHASASFALALAAPDQIVALPSGIRKQTHLFPQHLTNQIPLDIDRYNAETLFLAHPEVAFVAHYSHPAIVNALENQGIQLIHLNSIDTIPDIRSTLLEVGKVINKPMEADLLAIFMDAAMIAIDNCLLPLKESLKTPVLFLYHHNQYTIPTVRTLTGQMLQRIGIHNGGNAIPEVAQEKEWLVPLNHEQIAALNPQSLIIATADALSLQLQLQHDPALAQVAAIQQGRVHFVDESVQQFPSQYIVLAYYDIAHALVTPVPVPVPMPEG